MSFRFVGYRSQAFALSFRFTAPTTRCVNGLLVSLKASDVRQYLCHCPYPMPLFHHLVRRLASISAAKCVIELVS